MKKVKLFCKVFLQGKALSKSCSELRSCCTALILVPLFFSTVVILFTSISYLLARYTFLYTPIYKSNEELEICDLEQAVNCVLMGAPYTCAIIVYSLFTSIIYQEAKNNKKKHLLIFNTIFISIVALVYNSKLLAYLISDYATFNPNQEVIINCYYNTTINNYTLGCVKIAGNFCLFMIVLMVLIIFWGIILHIILYDYCKRLCSDVKEDLSTFDVQSVKIET